jgi:cell division protease FtsH
MAMGGRTAERLVFGEVSSGASDDLQRSTKWARAMVRTYGMSERIGPMAWGDNQQVFLGDDLMHTRDYSDDTARVIDEEVEKILRSAEERCRELLVEHRNGLDLVARALLEHETVDGAEINRLIDVGHTAEPDAEQPEPDAEQPEATDSEDAEPDTDADDDVELSVGAD